MAHRGPLAWLTAGLLILSVGGCIRENIDYGVRYDYNVNVDFGEIKTYAWHPVSSAVNIDPLNLERVKNAVESGLSARGLVQSRGTPDFFIVTYGGVLKEYTTRWLGYYSDDLYFEKGRLHLSFIDPKTNDAIWWGETEAKLKSYMTPEEKNVVISQTIERILAEFPPGGAH
jgi:hypothetical protein